MEKPDPAFFEHVIAEMDRPPAAIAYVGGRLDNDVLPAIAAGMPADDHIGGIDGWREGWL